MCCGRNLDSTSENREQLLKRCTQILDERESDVIAVQKFPCDIVKITHCAKRINVDSREKVVFVVKRIKLLFRD